LGLDLSHQTIDEAEGPDRSTGRNAKMKSKRVRASKKDEAVSGAAKQQKEERVG
jgi:hypothetical protein